MTEPGRLLAQGRNAQVFEYGDGLVLRRFNQPQSTDREVTAMGHARDQGFPVPEVHHADDREMVLERVDGPTMLADLSRRPWLVRRHAQTLARLHEQLHRIMAPPQLPARFGSGNALLHMDLHPDNVIMSRRGPVVIDWVNACAGAPEADVAQTWIIMATSEIPGSRRQQAVARAGRSLFVRAFLREAGSVPAGEIFAEVARARLADANLMDAERPRIEALAHKVGQRR